MKRKDLLAWIGVLGAILTFIVTQFGLQLDVAAVTTALGVVLVYVFKEMKADFARVKAQANKFRDPKFWAAFFVCVLTALAQVFGWNLPVEIINTVILFLLGLFWKAKPLATI